MKLPVSQVAAAKAGATRYNTGKKCLNGHQADRYTLTGGCVECIRERNSAHRKATKAAVLAGRAGTTTDPA